MKIKSFLAKPFASIVYKNIRKGMLTAVADQQAILKNLIKVGKSTQFGRDHKLDTVTGYEEFQQAVPVRDYEAFTPYINMIKEESTMFYGKEYLFILRKHRALPVVPSIYLSPKTRSEIILTRRAMPYYAIWPKQAITSLLMER